MIKYKIMLSQLKNLGLAEKEAKVYLSALELGTASVQNIARSAGVNRATTYVMIESLIKKGLISSFEQGKKRYFAATHPSQLLRTVRENQIALKQAEENLEKELLPELLSIHNIAGDQPKVRFFEGKEGLKAMCSNLLRTKSKKPKAKFSNKKEPFPTDIAICHNKVGITSFRQERPIGIIIEDKEIAETFYEILKKL